MQKKKKKKKKTSLGTETTLSQSCVCYHEDKPRLIVLWRYANPIARLERDQEAMKGLERSEYAEDHLVFEHLERYDMGEEYTVRE